MSTEHTTAFDKLWTAATQVDYLGRPVDQQTAKLWADIEELQKQVAELQKFGKVERPFQYAGEVAQFKANCDAIAQYAEGNPDKAAAILQELGTGEQSPLTPIPLPKPSHESTKALASGIQRKLGKPNFGEGKVDVRGSSAGKRLRKAIRDYRKDGEQATGRKPKK